MTGNRLALAAVLATGLLLLPAPLQRLRSEPADAPHGEPRIGDLHPGMPAAELLQRLGKPRYVARQILYGRYVEQWTYDAPFAVRVTFDWRKGQEKQIQTVQPLTTTTR